ncbi:MAG: glycosyltransferase family 2 protein [candidate division WOR-3 bacterium]|nr:MAG: glycosyltransferase family 2 protein [candidate division WOR-3 bacterium]
MKPLPTISILIPMLNEERYIVRCLDSVLANDYPQQFIEIIVIDGMSTDRSREIVKAYSKEHSFVHLIDNPKRIQSAGLNLGISAAHGKIILCMNAHTTYAVDYVKQCVEALETTGADNVSGVQCAVGTSYISDAIAVAITTPFGIGDARFRYSNKQQWVDTVFPGAWYKRTLDRLGGFNEEWVINEDYELNYRLRKAGGKILLSPRIHCQYYVRSTLFSFARQYSRYGYWKIRTLVAHPASLRWRHIMAPIFVLLLLLSMITMFISWRIGIVVPIIYGVSCVVASFKAARRTSWKCLPLLPLVFFVLHLSWGIGFWWGIVTFGVPKFTIKILLRAFKSF